MSTSPSYAVGPVVIRSPLLPFDELLAWSDGTTDREELVGRLRALLTRPLVRTAIELASTDFDSVLSEWLASDRPPDRKVVLAATRYLLRMTARATPFGLFATWSTGETGPQTVLELAGADGLHPVARLDTDVVRGLYDDLLARPDVRELLTYRSNPTIYSAAGRLRYIEPRTGTTVDAPTSSLPSTRP